MTRLSRDSNKKIVDNFYNRIGKSPALKRYLIEVGIDKDIYKLGGQAKRVKINEQGEVVGQ